MPIPFPSQMAFVHRKGAFLQAFSSRWLGFLILALGMSVQLSAVANETGRTSTSTRRSHRLLASAVMQIGSAVDSIVVTPTRFSPNDDGKLDIIKYEFAVQAPSQAVVLVTFPGQSAAIDTVQNDAITGTGRRTVKGSWDGRNGAGSIVADGTYDFLFMEIDSTHTSSNRRQFVVDTTSPVIDSLTITPQPYTPVLPSTPQDLLVRFRVSQSQLEDFVGVVILHGADTLVVDLLGDFAGDGFYSAPCRDCGDILGDGVHLVEAFGVDLAANQHVALDSVDTNLLGPAVTLSHPTLAEEFATQQADSLVGMARDRQAVASLSMLVSGALDTMLSLVATPAPDSTRLTFALDVAQLFAAEGVYELIFAALDVDGVSDSTRMLTYRVDRTAPPRPILSPPLGPTTRAQAVDISVAVDSTAEELLVTGAAIVVGPISINGQSVVKIVALPLHPGANTLTFRVVDFAGNQSAVESASIFRETTEGISAPERFVAGQSISIDAGSTAQSVQVRIIALDGALVKTFSNSQAAREYAFTWDLKTPEGLQVRNGAYMVVATVNAGASVQQYRKMIAVME